MHIDMKQTPIRRQGETVLEALEITCPGTYLKLFCHNLCFLLKVKWQVKGSVEYRSRALRRVRWSQKQKWFIEIEGSHRGVGALGGYAAKAP